MIDQRQSLNYLDAGVDIDAGEALIDAIKPIAQSTFRDGCISGLGGFGALFEVPKRFREPILVSGTDGVGTKLKLAFQQNRHDTIGIDLVAMCVNDVLVQGAEPLFFLDYFATGALSQETAIDVVRGIAKGCKQAGAALIGGETAEMPGMYQAGEYDLAGFCVGVVERDEMVTGDKIQPGDVIIGLGSSGFHSNGYSLVRKAIDVYNVDTTTEFHNGTLASHILAPTRIYVKPTLGLLKEVVVHGLAHITGGGLPGNIKRVLPKDTVASLDTSTWTRPHIYSWLQQTANIPNEEMYKTFNCGVGMIIIVSESDSTNTLDILSEYGETPCLIGMVEAGSGNPEVRLS